MSKLQKEYNLSIQDLSVSVIGFWKLFKQDKLNIEEALNYGASISTNIQHLFSIFKELDGVKIFKDHHIYFKLAIVHQHILNDHASFELFIGKMKSIIDINKVYRKNYSAMSCDTDNSHLLIANIESNCFGNILQVNGNLRKLLGYSEREMKDMSIEKLMPSLIREKHHMFVKKFMRNGNSYIVNNAVTMFVKKKNGYVSPVELYAKFTYSTEYQYSFMVIIKPFTVMAPFVNGFDYKIEQLMFLLVDDSKEGLFTDYSESCITLLQNYGYNGKHQQNDMTLNIRDFVTDINYSEVMRNRGLRYKNKEIYEGLHKVNLSHLAGDIQIPQKFTRAETNIAKSLLKVRLRIFEERYSGGLLDMNIFCMAIVKEYEDVSTRTLSIIPIPQDTNYEQLVQAEVFNLANEEFLQESTIDRDSMRHGTNSASSTSSLSKVDPFSDLRSYHLYSDVSTPRTLSIIIRLTVALYLIMISFATVSIGITWSMQLQSQSDILTLEQAFTRMNWQASSIMYSRVLTNIANGYEPDTNGLITNRFEKYKALQLNAIQQLQSAHQYLLQSDFVMSPQFEDFINSDSCVASYLNNQNQPYTETETLNIDYSVFLTMLTSMNSFTSEQMISNVTEVSIHPVVGPYTPSVEEQTLYYIFQNGQLALRKSTINACDFYGRDAVAHSQKNISSAMIISIISIISILIIGTIVSPMLTRAETRRYKSLMYFLKIPKTTLTTLVTNCEYCLHIDEEDHYLKITQDYQEYLGQKFPKQSNTQEEQKHDNLSSTLITSDNSHKVMQWPSSIHLIASHHEPIIKSFQHSVKQPSLVDTINAIKKQQNILEIDQDGNSEDIPVVEESVSPDESLLNKVTLMKRIFNRSLKTGIAMVTLVGIMTTYFIISYFLSIETFNTASEVITPLELIFYRGTCFDQTMMFMRAYQVLNKTLLISDPGASAFMNSSQQFPAVDIYLGFCNGMTNSYQNLVINPPSYLAGVIGVMLDLEMLSMCDLIYTGQFASLNELCKTQLNGILDEGLINAFAFMTQKILLADLKFLEIGARNRNDTVLREMLNDTMTLEVIDLKAIVIDPTLTSLKHILMTSIIDYIKGLLTKYLVAFIIFSSMLTIGMILLLLIGFHRIKRNMLSTNILLRIIPFEKLLQKDREEIKVFFKD